MQDDTPRHISHESVAAWATEHSDSFDSHSIYYNEDNPDAYLGKPKQEYQPFLSKEVALAIIEKLLHIA